MFDAHKIASQSPGWVKGGDPLDMPCDLFEEVADSIPEDEQMEAIRNSRKSNRLLNALGE